MKLAKTLVLDLLEHIIVEQFFDERVLERLARSIRRGELADVGRVEQIGGKTCRRVLRNGSRRSMLRDRCGRLVPDFESLQTARLGLR